VLRRPIETTALPEKVGSSGAKMSGYPTDRALTRKAVLKLGFLLVSWPRNRGHRAM